MKVAVLTISDSCSKGERKDESSQVLLRLLAAQGAVVCGKAVVCDDKNKIKSKLKYYCSKCKADVILTTGGTGLGPRDVTPEATKDVIDKEAPGIAELMRLEGLKNTKRAVLSRGIAGVRGKTLIINFPGSPKGAAESFLAVADIIPHALAMIKGEGH